MSDLIQTAIRLDESTLDRADTLQEHVRGLHANSRTTRSDVLRVAIQRGLADLEREAARNTGTVSTST